MSIPSSLFFSFQVWYCLTCNTDVFQIHDGRKLCKLHWIVWLSGPWLLVVHYSYVQPPGKPLHSPEMVPYHSHASCTISMLALALPYTVYGSLLVLRLSWRLWHSPEQTPSTPYLRWLWHVSMWFISSQFQPDTLAEWNSRKVHSILGNSCVYLSPFNEDDMNDLW